MSSINNIEIERKFLVKDASYKALATRSVRIQQGYLCLNTNCSVRVRRWDTQAFLTIKSKEYHWNRIFKTYKLSEWKSSETRSLVAESFLIFLDDFMPVHILDRLFLSFENLGHVRGLSSGLIIYHHCRNKSAMQLSCR